MTAKVGEARVVVVHIVFRLDYGGLENGLVNVINGLSNSQMGHVVVALTEATEFAQRLTEGVAVYSLGKRPGKDFGAYVRLYRLLRRLKPDIVHTRNFGTLDCALVAFLAGVPRRIHGEHGRDVDDPNGDRLKYRLVRRCLSPLIQQFVVVSEELQAWLVKRVGISPAKVRRICNGVDIQRFHPRAAGGKSALPAALSKSGAVVIGSVTRFSAIKDPMNLVEAFLAVRRQCGRLPAVLVMIGDGELHKRAVERLDAAGAGTSSWLPGSRDDIPELLRAMDVFVLGSLREGISNTLLEAMASGLAVVATDTGGNDELVDAGVNGILVPPGDSKALAAGIQGYLTDPARRAEHGHASRSRTEAEFTIDRMIDQYRSVYSQVLGLAVV